MQCEFRYAGCEAEFIRDKQKKQNILAYIATIPRESARKSSRKLTRRTFDQKFQDQHKKKHKVVKEFRDMQASGDEFQRKRIKRQTCAPKT